MVPICIRHAFNSYSELIAEDGNRIDGYAEHHGISSSMAVTGTGVRNVTNIW
jgi:hypothetical protein